MPICWTMPDGSVKVMQLSDRFVTAQQRPGETTADTVTRLAVGEQAKNPDLSGATAQLVKTADLPGDRSTRDQWRVKNGKVEVDLTVPRKGKP